MKIACTQCERVAEREGLIGWIETVRPGCDIRMLGDRSMEGLFCSAPCLVAYFTERPSELNGSGQQAAAR